MDPQQRENIVMRYFFPLHIAVEVNTHFSVSHLHKFPSFLFFFKVCAAKSDKVHAAAAAGRRREGRGVTGCIEGGGGGVMPLFVYLFILKESKTVVHRARANRFLEFGLDKEEMKKQEQT